MRQLLTPNPNIPCEPGWCLAYVNEAFVVPKRYGTATAAWQGSATKHRDYDFPDGWVPVWFSLATEPAGHVALRAPDGSIYSTSDDATVPHHHPDMADLIRYYSAHNPLTYLGWTEDVEGTPVISPDNTGLSYAGTITPERFLMALTDEQQATLYNAVLNLEGFVWKGGPSTQKGDGDPTSVFGRVANTQDVVPMVRDIQLALTTALPALLNKPGADPAATAKAVAAAIPADLAKQVADELGKRIQGDTN